MNPALESLIDRYLEPLPLPVGGTSRELVRRCIEYACPARVPFSFFQPLRSDFCELVWLEEAIETERGARPRRAHGSVYVDAWGIRKKVSGGRWDRVVEFPLADLKNAQGHSLASVDDPARFEQLASLVERAGKAGKYRVGFDPVTLFERACELVGFERLMVAPYTQPDGLCRLLDRLADLTVSVIDQWGRIGGIDAFMTWDDWGLQGGLPLRLETFRRFYSPRYARIIEAAHQRGMHFIWHNCGQILDMIPEMIALGTDVIQMDQPRLVGHEKLAEAFGGSVCFWNSVDTQWSVQENLTEVELRNEVAHMVRPFQSFPGGFMARQYPHGHDIRLSPERHRMIHEAFLAYGGRL